MFEQVEEWKLEEHTSPSITSRVDWTPMTGVSVRYCTSHLDVCCGPERVQAWRKLVAVGRALARRRMGSERTRASASRAWQHQLLSATWHRGSRPALLQRRLRMLHALMRCRENAIRLANWRENPEMQDGFWNKPICSFSDAVTIRPPNSLLRCWRMLVR